MRATTPRCHMAIASWLGLVTVMAPQKQQCMAVDTVIQAMDQRHNAPPPHKTVNKKYPTTAVGVASEKLMVSPCRPEKDGYFGSTYGDPATLQYAFAMESRMNADISEALFVVQEYVMDVTIASTFPAICSARDLSVSAAENSNGVTGFKFGQEYAAIQSCVPRESSSTNSDCGIYSGTLSVFGNDLSATLATTILKNLMMELPAVVDKLTGYGVTRVEGSEDFSKLKQVPNSITPSRGGKPFLTKRAKVGLIFIVLIIFTGIAVLMHFIYVEKAIIYQQQLLSPKGPVPIGKASVGRGWKLSRLYRHVANHDCDATQASLPSCSTSNSIAKCRRNNEGSRTKRSSVVGKKKTARKTSKKSGQPMLSVQYEEPESIYIVDPDESVYICDKDSDSLYGNDPLCSMGLETF